jgi:hypothetical protein
VKGGAARLSRLGVVIALGACVVVGCTTIPDPSGLEPSGLDAGPVDGESDASVPAERRCRKNIALWNYGNEALLYEPARQVILAASDAIVEKRDGGTEDFIYATWVAGNLARVEEGRTVDLGADLSTCAHCFVAFSGCAKLDRTGTCERTYVAVGGRFRAVRMTTAPGSFWFDVADVELARIVERDGVVVKAIDREDCVYVPRVTLIGNVSSVPKPSPCNGVVDITCGIIDTASDRRP